MTQRNKIRIPIYNEEYLFNIYDEIEIVSDVVDTEWTSEHWQPQIWDKFVGVRYDKYAHYEIHRLMKFGSCPFCRESMVKLAEEIQPGTVFVCTNCYYWGGRGTRRVIEGPTNGRANLGRIRFLENLDEISENQLISHLRKHHDDIVNLTPKQAEQLVPKILKDYLGCEVKALGGVKDGGIDALAIRSDNSKMIIQIKWRERSHGAEAVSVIREVGGTLLSRGIPSGLIVSTKDKFSNSAVTEAKLISERIVDGIGKLHIDLADFNSLIDMFEISHKVRSEIKQPQDIIPFWDPIELFG